MGVVWHKHTKWPINKNWLGEYKHLPIEREFRWLVGSYSIVRGEISCHIYIVQHKLQKGTTTVQVPLADNPPYSTALISSLPCRPGIKVIKLSELWSRYLPCWPLHLQHWIPPNGCWSSMQHIYLIHGHSTLILCGTYRKCTGSKVSVLLNNRHGRNIES